MQRLQEAGAIGLDVLRLVAEGLGHALQHVDEARPAVPRGIGEVGAAPERLAVGRAEHGERPAALFPQDMQRLHVDGVDVGALLAIDLDVDEQLVHHRRDLRRFEALVRHDMAPMAGGIADREQDRPVGAPGLGQRLLAPRPPMNGIFGMLQQIGAGLGTQAIHAGCSPRLPSLLTRRTRECRSSFSASTGGFVGADAHEAGQPRTARWSRRDGGIAAQRMGEQAACRRHFVLLDGHEPVRGLADDRPGHGRDLATGQAAHDGVGIAAGQCRPARCIALEPAIRAFRLDDDEGRPLGQDRPQIADHRGGKPAHAGLDEHMRGPLRAIAARPPRAPARNSRA